MNQKNPLTLPTELSTPEARLVFNCCRGIANHEKDNELAALVKEVHNWQWVIKYAQENFVAPLLSFHLTQNQLLSYLPTEHQETLEQIRVNSMRRNLLQLAELRALVKMLPPASEYLIVKGLALGGEFYQDYSLRHSRDIDILLSKELMLQLLERLLENGYRLKQMDQKFENLATLVELSAEVGVISPRGVLIELHQRLSLAVGHFPLTHHELIANRKAVTLGNTSFMTLNDEQHFLYCCYHHSRHHWSRLHWLADINTMLLSGKLNNNQIGFLCKKLGQSHAVASALHLCQQLLNNPQAGKMLQEFKLQKRGVILAKQGIHYLGSKQDKPEHLRGPFQGLQALLYGLSSQDRWHYKLKILKSFLHPSILDTSNSQNKWYYYFAYLIRPVRITKSYTLALFKRRAENK